MPAPTIPGVTPPTPALPANWTNVATTTATFNAAVIAIQGQLGAAAAAEFRSWYTSAWAADRAITPNQAVAAWVTGSTLAQNLGATAGALGQIPQAAATGANNAYTGLNTATGGAVAAAGTAWDAATAIPRFLSMLTSANLWLRVGEVIAGLILFGIGVNALFKGKPLATVTNIAGKAAPLAMGA